MLQRMKSKKGFTLAELLIVVAIIAVLTAIAVPLFVKGIQDAEKATGAANVRAVRGTAVSVILLNSDETTGYFAEKYKTEGDATKTYAWYVTAKVSKGGDVTDLAIKETAPADDYATAYAGEGYEKKGDDYLIAFKLTQTDLPEKA